MLTQSTNAASDKKVELKNGEANVEDEKKKTEAACNIQNPEGAMEMKMDKREVEIVEAAQAWEISNVEIKWLS